MPNNTIASNAAIMAGPGVTGVDTSLRQRMIEQLAATQAPQGRMLGGLYAPPNVLAQLNAAIAPFVAKKQDEQLQKDRATQAGLQRAAMQAELAKLTAEGPDGTVPREQVIQAMGSQFSPVQSIGASEFKRMQEENTPLMRMVKQAMAGQAAGGMAGGLPPGNMSGGGGMAGAGTGPINLGARNGAAMPPDAMGATNPPGVQTNPAIGPQSGAIAAMQRLFPNLDPTQAMTMLAADPSGKTAAAANLKQGEPIVAGNNVFSRGPGGAIGNAPGSLEAMAAAVRAQEQAKAPFGTPIPVTGPGGQTVLMRPDQVQGAAGELPGGGARGQVLDAMAGGPIQPRPGAGSVEQELAQRSNVALQNAPRAQQQQLGILQQELGQVTSPADREAILREMTRVQNTGSPTGRLGGRAMAPVAQVAPRPVASAQAGIPIQSPAAEKIAVARGQNDVKALETGRTDALASRNMLRSLDSIRQSVNSGAYTGKLGDVKTLVSAWADAAGLPVDTRKLTASQTAASALKLVVLPQLKQTGHNPSNVDLKFVTEALGGTTVTQATLNKIIDIMEKSATSSIDNYQRMQQHFTEQGNLNTFDFGLGRETPEAGKPVSAADYFGIGR